MICEAHSGAWSPVARRVLDRFARGAAGAQGEEVDATSLQWAQRISVTLHRANARAILLRAAVPSSAGAADNAWADVAFDSV